MAELKIITMEDVPVTEVKWLWYPYIPYGKLTIIHGDPGDGKTMMLLQLATILSIVGVNRKIKMNKISYGYRNFNRFRNRILHIFSLKSVNCQKQATA